MKSSRKNKSLTKIPDYISEPLDTRLRFLSIHYRPGPDQDSYLRYDDRIRLAEAAKAYNTK